MKRENNHGEGGHVCPSFLQRKHNRECTLRKRRKKRHRRNQSRRRVWEWKCLTLQLLLAVIFVFSVAGLLGYGIFYLSWHYSLISREGRGFLDMASSICVRMRVAETRKKNYKTYEENRKNCFYYIIYFGIY